MGRKVACRVVDVEAGDLCGIVIKDENCSRYYLPEADELVECGGPSRDQIVARIVFDNHTQTELRGREDIPIKSKSSPELTAAIIGTPRDNTTTLYWYDGPRGVSRPIPQVKRFEKEARGVRRYQVPSSKDGDPFTWPQVFRRET